MAEKSGAGRYSPDRKGLMLKYGSVAATGIIAGGSIVTLGACGGRREQWAETSGQAGQINLEAVEEAMKKSKDVSAFEKRVNEIYQGEEMVLIEVKNEGREQLVSGYTDLNNNLNIDYVEGSKDNADEKLFTFRRWYEGNKPNPSYAMRGYGVNSYYYHPYPYGMNMLSTYMLVSALRQPMYMTHTTVIQRQSTRTSRDNYRKTPSYRNRVDTNRRYQSRMSSKHGATYRKASPSASRQRWATRKGVNLNKATRTSQSAGRRSSTGSRSSWGSRVSRGFSGGRGGSAVGPAYSRSFIV